MEKIKRFLEGENSKDILTVIILILVGLGSFGLGRLSTRGQSEGLKIEYTKPVISLEANIPINPVNQLEEPKEAKVANKATVKTTFFASKRGSKYYSASCSGGKTIKPENKIYFSSEVEAEGAGYELSSTCR